MKSLSLCLVLACLVFSGCEHVRSDIAAGMREKVSGPTYHRRVFKADPKVTYEAARAVVAKMNYRFVRGGPAQRHIEAIGEVVTNDSIKRTRQVTLLLDVNSSQEGSEVSVLFKEALEGDFAKDADITTERSVKDTMLYDVLFDRMDAELRRPAK